MKTMQQYWVTKKSVSRKFGGKEDECIVSSDAELDAKLELFRSIAETCAQLQKVIDAYQERLCLLADEENSCGRYMKECGKAERNATAGQIMTIAGKSLSYSGHQRLTLRPCLVRLHHEVETFRGRAVSDTRMTVMEMEKARTEYRAALSWMKSVSAQLDPDTGHGLEKFRKAQNYVRTSKVKFDKFMLACLQKVDLLAAARCNMFSHALVAYQKGLKTVSNKTYDTLIVALSRLQCVEPYNLSILTGATNDESDEKDKKTFFNSEYSDDKTSGAKTSENDSVGPSTSAETTDDETTLTNTNEAGISNDLLGEDFSHFNQNANETELTQQQGGNQSELFGLSWPTTPSTYTTDLFASSDFMPSSLLQQDFNALTSSFTPFTGMSGTDVGNNGNSEKQTGKLSDSPTTSASKEAQSSSSQMTWLSLFAELDPLAQENASVGGAADRA